MSEMKKKQNDQTRKNEAEVQIPLADLIKIRREKVLKLREMNINPYPYRYEPTHLIEEVLKDFNALSEKEEVIRLTGRILLKRKMGKSFFAHIRDMTEAVQIYLKLDVVGKDVFDLFNMLDLGDIIGCEGTLFVTKTGERTLRVTGLELLSKSLHPLPDKHAGLTDVETRYRRRYADLIINPEVREVFIKRSRIIQIIRDFLNKHGFLEVETPILQPLYGGGNARPFTTHHEKLDIAQHVISLLL